VRSICTSIATDARIERPGGIRRGQRGARSWRVLARRYEHGEELGAGDLELAL
jgi:hypothetical protein